jgi:hypothetical protein
MKLKSIFLTGFLCSIALLTACSGGGSGTDPDDSTSTYTGSLATSYSASNVSINLSNCTNLSSNGTFVFDEATYKINSGNDLSHQGIGVFTATIGANVNKTTIESTGSIDNMGNVNGTYTSTFTVDGATVTTGDGSFDGTLSGNNLTLNITAQDRTGDTCLAVGTVNFVAQNTGGTPDNGSGSFGSLSLSGVDTGKIGTQFTPSSVNKTKPFTYQWQLESNIFLAAGSFIVSIDTNGMPIQVIFAFANVELDATFGYNKNCTLETVDCSQLVIDQSAQTIDFNDFILDIGDTSSSSATGPLTVNGTLNYGP